MTVTEEEEKIEKENYLKEKKQQKEHAIDYNKPQKKINFKWGNNGKRKK